MRIAFAGLSHWHLGLYLDAARATGTEVMSVWDANLDASRRLSKEIGIGASSSLADLLAQKPDLVVVMGRPDALSTVIPAVFQSGLPMILEKPAVTSTPDLEPLVERAGGEGLFVAVPLPNRMSPLWPDMAGLAGAGRLGPVSHAHFRIVNGPPKRYRDDGVPWLLDPAVSGGGALRNLGIHGIDAALTLADSAGLKVVSATVNHRLYGEAVEDYAAVTLRSADGMTATIEAGYTFASMAAGGDFEWRVSAQNAHLLDRGDSCRVATLDDGALRELTPLPPARRYTAFFADTLDRLSRGAPPAVGIADYWRAMRLIDEAYRHART